MSGGDYNHLHSQVFRGELVLSDLTKMAKRLDQLAPGSAAAADTRALLDALHDDKLAEVWRAVEWLDSGDEDGEQTQEAVAEYGATRSTGPNR